MPYKIIKTKRGNKTTCRVRSVGKINGKYKYYSKKGIPCARAQRQLKLLEAVENGYRPTFKKSSKRPQRRSRVKRKSNTRN